MTNLVVLLAGLLPLYVIRFPLFGIPTNLFEVGVWITALFVIPDLLRPSVALGEGGIRNPRPHMSAVFILLFLIAAAISTIVSPVTRSSLGILKSWVVTPILFGVLVRITADKKAIIGSLILSGLIVALFGLSQIHGFNRIYSIYDVPNSLALFLVPISVLAALIGSKTNNRLYQYAAGVMIIAIILTQSLGAIIALIGTMIVGGFVGRHTHPLQLPLEKGERIATSPPLFKGRLGGVRKNSWRIFAFLFIAMAIFLLSFTLSGRLSYLISPLINPNTTNSVTVRMQLWDIGAHLIRQHPILGIGLGQFEPAYQAELYGRLAEQANEANAATSYKLASEFVFRDPHNWIISFWLNLGILGLIAFIGLNFITIKNAFLLKIIR